VVLLTIASVTQIYLNSSFPNLHLKYCFHLISCSIPNQIPPLPAKLPNIIVRMNISQLVSSIDDAISNLAQGGAESDTDRQELLAAATRLQAATESPLASVTSIVLGVSCEVFLDSFSSPWVTKKLL
jgi:hypothetical protein